jgi:hypothetical protein
MGLFNPNLSRVSAIFSLLARGPVKSRAGSDGTRREMIKVIVNTPMTTKIAKAKRRIK